MGGLAQAMPYTYVAFLIGALALVGIPPLSGFCSKDAILASALADGGALRLAALRRRPRRRAPDRASTRFRLYFLVFHGEPSPLVRERARTHGPTHGHGEGPLLDD